MRDFERVEQKIVEKMTLEQIFSRARRIIQNEEIKPEDFKDLYGEKNVERDEQCVKQMEEEFEKELEDEQRKINPLPIIFEAVLDKHGEQSDWFGPFACMIKPSRYDKLKNGIHNIIEFKKEDFSALYLALAIDVTFGVGMQKKFERIKREIDEGKLARVKYFRSDRLGIRGELSHLPRVVIGVEPKTVKEIGELWIHKKNAELGNHQIQFQMLEEISIQVKAFAEYAQKQDKIDIADVYKKTADIIEEISQEKKKNLKDDGERDNVFHCIKYIAESFSKE